MSETPAELGRRGRAGPAEAIDAGELARRLADLTLHERVERGLDTCHAKGPDAGMRQVVVEYRPVRLGDVPAVRDLLAAWRAAEEARSRLADAYIVHHPPLTVRRGELAPITMPESWQVLLPVQLDADRIGARFERFASREAALTAFFAAGAAGLAPREGD
jgi:hypothetical protein